MHLENKVSNFKLKRKKSHKSNRITEPQITQHVKKEIQPYLHKSRENARKRGRNCRAWPDWLQKECAGCD